MTLKKRRKSNIPQTSSDAGTNDVPRDFRPGTIEQEIFEEFLASLAQDNAVPSDLVTQLRRLGVVGVSRAALSDLILGVESKTNAD